MRRTVLTVIAVFAVTFAANPFKPAASGRAVPEANPSDFRVGFWDIARFDPLVTQPNLPEELTIRSYPADGTGWYMVQFSGPVSTWQTERIEKAGARFLGFHSRHLAFVKMNTAVAGQVSSLPFIRWVGLYQPGYKFWSGTLADEGFGRVSVMLFYPEDVQAAVRDLEALGCAVVRTGTSDVMKVVEVDCAQEQLADIARLGWVMSVEEWHPAEKENEQCQWVVQTWSSNQRRVWSQGLFGQDEILGWTDTGLDVNHWAFRDPAVAISDTGEFPTHRKVVVFKHYPAAGGVGDPDGHGTHVGGTMAGNDSVNGGTNLNDGHSKSARLVHLSPIPQPPGNDFTVPLNMITNNLRNPSLRPHTIGNSWWTGTKGQYTAAASTFDLFAWKNKDVVLIKSCGNQYHTSQYQITEPGNGKSVVAAASLQNGTSATLLSDYSSSGPAPDGRIKPDLSIPGENIMSVQAGSQNSYTSMSGTSMSSPATNGAVGLLRSYLRKGYYPSGAANPADTWGYVSSAVLRAMLLVSADPNVESYVVPSDHIGWGRVDLDSVLYFTGDARKLLALDDTTGLSTGQYDEYQFEVTDSLLALRASVVWTDTAAASGANPVLINNLDCLLTGPDASFYKGDLYTSGQSTRNPAGAYDNLNPLEMFRVNRPAQGQWTLRVTAQNVVTARQPYAVVVTGAIAMGARNDVGVTAILAPVDTVDTGTTVTPTVIVRNFGTGPETFPVWMSIGADYSDSVEVTLASGAVDTVQFLDWTADSVGTFAVVCLTDLAGDENPDNDTLSDSVVVWPPTGIAEEPGLPQHFALAQGQPTPFAGRTVIRYALPFATGARLCIYNSAGCLVRVLHSGSERAGYHRVIWNGRDESDRRVAGGIYYCRLEAGDFQSIKKLVKLD